MSVYHSKNAYTIGTVYAADNTAPVGKSSETITAGKSSLVIGKLAAPQNVKWDHSKTVGTITFDAVYGSEGDYKIELYCEDTLIHHSNWSGLNTSSIISREMGYIDFPTSGKYTVKVTANGDDINTFDSETAVSDVWDYVKPSTALATPASLAWKNSSIATWQAVEDADCYYVQLYNDGKKSNAHWGFSKTEYDLTENITSSGKYTFTVRALSKDISKICNSAESSQSAVYDFTAVIGEVIDKLDDINNNKNVDDAITTLKGIEKNELAGAMQSSSDALAKVKSFEDKYVAEKKISVSSSISDDLKDTLSGSISTIGAGLNATGENSSITLNFKKPEKLEDVTKLAGTVLKNVIQLDIGLKEVPSGELAVPVRITMPIPKGVLPERLVVLHYRKDGSCDKIYPDIKGNTASFTVTHFSTFAFANEETTSNSSNGSSNSGETSDTISNSVTGVSYDLSKVILPNGYSSDNTFVSARIYSESSDISKAVRAIAEKSFKNSKVTNVIVDDLNLLDLSGVPIKSFSGNIKVKLPLPKGISEFAHVYYYNETDKTLTDVNATINNCYIEFETNHFSYYAIIDFDSQVTQAAQAATSSKANPTTGIER